MQAGQLSLLLGKCSIPELFTKQNNTSVTVICKSWITSNVKCDHDLTCFVLLLFTADPCEVGIWGFYDFVCINNCLHLSSIGNIKMNFNTSLSH